MNKSELITNKDGSIYHLGLLPEQVANTIITVGDPNRVAMITKHFENIEFKINKREFVTHTGSYNGKRITVISTGIGTDNIDIVINEIDALVNIDLKTLAVKKNLKQLNFIRIGTTGAVQEDLPNDSLVANTAAIGIDNLLHFYNYKPNVLIENRIKERFQFPINPYYVKGSQLLYDKFKNNFIEGIAITSPGFYGPQNRNLRLSNKHQSFFEKIRNFEIEGLKVTNLEMETAGIFGLAELLGHQAISLNAVLANRINGSFSENPSKTIESLIRITLKSI